MTTTDVLIGFGEAAGIMVAAFASLISLVFLIYLAETRPKIALWFLGFVMFVAIGIFLSFESAS